MESVEWLLVLSFPQIRHHWYLRHDMGNDDWVQWPIKYAGIIVCRTDHILAISSCVTWPGYRSGGVTVVCQPPTGDRETGRVARCWAGQCQCCVCQYMPANTPPTTHCSCNCHSLPYFAIILPLLQLRQYCVQTTVFWKLEVNNLLKTEMPESLYGIVMLNLKSCVNLQNLTEMLETQ